MHMHTIIFNEHCIHCGGLWLFWAGPDKQMIQYIAPGLSCPDKLLHYKVKTAPWEKVRIPSQTKHPLNPTISFSHHLIIFETSDHIDVSKTLIFMCPTTDL